MGAIAGICYREENNGSGETALGRMIAKMKHRGGYVRLQKPGGKCVLGGRREFPFDSDSGPVSGALTGLTVVMDGDIFNCTEGGFSGNEGSDNVRMIIDLYQKFGLGFVEKIDGPCAIALYDAPLDRLVLVRDRLGAKPLYYVNVRGTLGFASEIKGILAAGIYEKSVDTRALNYFLSFGYPPNPYTLFESIWQVKPGCMLICEKGEIREKSYWRFAYRKEAQRKSDDHYIERFRDIFKIAVERRVKKYPDAGAFLSGGLDSSSVTAMMHKLLGNGFKVFSAAFKEKEYNEIVDAKIVANHFELDHIFTEVCLEKNFFDLIEKLVWHYDAPFIDTSAIPSYYVAALAREHCQTVLTGDFPDQLIGGSGHQTLALHRQMNDPVWKKLVRNGLANRLATSLMLSAGGTSLVDKIKRSLYRETFSLEEQRVILSMPVPPNLKGSLYSDELLAVNKNNDAMGIARSLYREVADESLLNKILYFDIISYASDDLMVKVDRTNSAVGLNSISPYHDWDLVAFIAKLPVDLKIRGDNRKYILREAVRQDLPQGTLMKKKQGFAMPIGEWLVRSLPDEIRDLLFDPKTLNRGYFNKTFAKTMVENFLKGRTDYATGSESTIIALVTLELWHRKFIDA